MKKLYDGNIQTSDSSLHRTLKTGANKTLHDIKAFAQQEQFNGLNLFLEVCGTSEA